MNGAFLQSQKYLCTGSVDRTCDTLKEMQQEAKLKELADKAVAARS
tara:strand:- start:874 stop:1011 length:138 start_codon:yes stop_codon:yes gene_type:complete